MDSYSGKGLQAKLDALDHHNEDDTAVLRTAVAGITAAIKGRSIENSDRAIIFLAAEKLWVRWGDTFFKLKIPFFFFFP
jgi:hypothetical protein